MKKMPKIYLRKGNSPLLMDANLRDVLEALWGIAENGVVDGLQLESEKIRYQKHFKLLNERGCIEIVESVGGRGRPGIAKIRLLKRTLDPAVVKDVGKKERVKLESLGLQPASPPPGLELVSKKELERLREQAKKPADARSNDEVALLFVDAENLTGHRKFIDGQGKDSGPRILPIGQVNWNVFMETVAHGYRRALHIREAIAYVSSSIPNMQFVKYSLSAARFKSIFYDKDTDALTAADIVHFCRDEMECSKRITLVLVSGDRDYCRAVECVREAARRTNTSLQVWIISWKYNLSPRLREVADWVSYVESIPGFLDRMIQGNIKRPIRTSPSFQALQ